MWPNTTKGTSCLLLIFALSTRRFNKCSNDTKFPNKIEVILLKEQLLQSLYFILFYLYFTHYCVHYIICHICHMIKEMSHLSKMSISIFLHHFLKTSKCFILMQTQYNWISGYKVMKNLTMLKTIWNEGIQTLFLPISQKQHPWHPTHSSWSCHIFTLL